MSARTRRPLLFWPDAKRNSPAPDTAAAPRNSDRREIEKGILASILTPEFTRVARRSQRGVRSLYIIQDRFKYFENTLNPRAIHAKKDEIRSGYRTLTGVGGGLITVAYFPIKG